MALAQCGSDTNKHTCFEYPDLVAQIWAHPQLGMTAIDDFGVAYVNPNGGSNGHVWIRTTLIADDPNFEYKPTCANPNFEGKCIGTYDFPDKFLEPYSGTQHEVGWSHNPIPFAFPHCNEDIFGWVGTVRVESIAKGQVTVKPFYSASPYKINVSSFTSQSTCDAWENTWQAFDEWIDASWDGDIQRIVIPWGFGEHGHPQEPTCTFFNEEVIETTVSIPNGQSQDIDAFRFHIADSEVSFHDTSLFIRLNPLVSGTEAAARVFPNADGTALCPEPEP